MKSIECANELYLSFCQEHAIKSKTNLPSCSPINGNMFVPSSWLIKIMQATDKLVRETLMKRQDASKQRKRRILNSVVEGLEIFLT